MMRRLFATLFGLGKTTTAADDTGAVQKIQVKLSQYETLDHRMVMGTYGLISSPPVGSDVLLACLSNERTNSVVIGHNHQQYRFKGAKPGESGLANPVAGSSVLLAEDGTLIIKMPGAKIIAEGATIIADDFQTSAGIKLSDHVHPGVQSGSSKTQGPVEP
ncbi:phage baseplate assembly protein domain-containing protein [Kozakia baliensis]|uniref:Bacteriophage Mu Gp45 N-terminal domain-containing protein n=1 Tax=Kozakia baliensis TaxID=153496 RepID=A0A1D8UTH1_9PROT|nr:phage baseplate assembly protein [Kozakia baliensis]AOX16916.1 hypothetical protein A0U89_06955 [Kozakia baliensis]GBR25606.1 bacteriophage protein [Kozakia baliensis NRIC 0488]GEL64037.1 hypothetical protein KBA01_13230 [Kozakia baliensis]